MAPHKKRLLKVLVGLYVVFLLAMLVNAIRGTRGTARLYALTPAITGASLAEPLVVASLEGAVLEADLAEALDGAGVETVALADGTPVRTEEARGKPLGAVALPAGTEITEALWTEVLAPESLHRPDERIPVTGEGNIIGFSIDLGLTVLNFLGLLCILYVFLWDPILDFLDRRAEKIRDDLAAAEKQRSDAASLRDRYAEMMRGAKQEREELVASGQRDGEAERRKIVERARAEAEKVLEQARAEIGAETSRARRDLRREVGTLSTQIAAEVLRRELRPEDHEALVRSFLEKVEAAGDGDGPAPPDEE